MNAIILQPSAISLAISAATAQFKATAGVAGKYDEMAKIAANGSKKADPATHDALRVQFVFGYCKAAGIAAAVSDKGAVILANPDSTSKTDSDVFEDTKGDARSVYGMGMNRAYKRLDITAPPKKNAGGTKPGTTPPGTTPPATVPGTVDTSGIPVSILRDTEALVMMLSEFGASAKLTKADTARFGAVCDTARKLLASMDGKATPPAAPAK